MATPARTHRAVAALYAELTPTERARLMARLARAHDTAEMNRLCDATPPAQAAAYNRALALLRVLNGKVPDWVTILHLGMERDRLRLQHVVAEGAHRWLTRSRLGDAWALVGYPVTEGEYRTLVGLERAEPEPLGAYAEHLAECDGTEPGLNPAVADLLRGLPPDLARLTVPDDHPPGAPFPPEELAEDVRRADAIAARLRRLMDAAIRRGELPKPTRKGGEPCLPAGALSDWGKGTTPATFEPFGPGYHVPALGELFGGDLADWDVRPDAEADAVRGRRRELRAVFLSLAGAYGERREAAPALDPPATAAEQRRQRTLAARLSRAWHGRDDLAGLALAAAQAHAGHRGQFEALAAAVEAIRQGDFGGEDPLWPEVRVALDGALAEAARFRDAWQGANETPLRLGLREASGLPPFPPRGEGALDEPAPLPEGEVDAGGMEDLIREWADAS